MAVNGPEDTILEWEAINWPLHEDNVRRLRGRIFTATKSGDWPKVRNLQKLMLRSRACTLVSVRQVTQRNAGRGTAGIDGEVALTPEARRRWRCGCTSPSRRGVPGRSGACIYRRHQTVRSSARSAFPC